MSHDIEYIETSGSRHKGKAMKVKHGDYYADTAMCIALALAENNHGRPLTPDNRHIAIWLAAVLDDAWDDLPRDLADGNSECWDIVVVPEFLELVWRHVVDGDSMPNTKVAQNWLRARIEDLDEEETMSGLQDDPSDLDWKPGHPLQGHEIHTIADWRYAVGEGDTRLGYVDWVNEQIAQAAREFAA